MSDVDHRRLAADLYNHTWTLIERSPRTRDEDDEMLYSTFASAYHWLRVEGAGPEHRARSEWQIARVLSELGRGDEETLRESVARAREAGTQIADAEDRGHFERALAELS